jgi:restriction endonuclease S subunit
MITATHKGKYYDVEYSIVNVSELEGELRIDAEYYDPYYLEDEKKIKNKNWEFLIDKSTGRTITDGSHEMRQYVDRGILFLRVQDIFENYIEVQEQVYISEEENKKLKRSAPRKYKDILITKTGKIGVASVFYLNKRANIPADIAILKNNSNLNSFYIATFINSYYGKISMQHQMTGLGRPRLVLESFKYIKIPLPSETFQKFIEKLVLKAYEERQKAEQLYKQAEEILLEELDLKDWKPKSKKIKIGRQEFKEEENISIKMLSEVVKADRMDAEYWEPKYDEIEDLIKKYKNGYDYLPNLIDISKKKIKINEDEIYHYIELADINPNLGVVNQTKQIKGKKLPSRARMKVEKGYVIMSSVEGSIDKIALIDFERENLVASTGFFVFKERELNKETLLVLLKILAKKYIIREAQGTILTAIPYDSLNRIVIPKVHQQTQQKISQLIQQSFEARENSKKLLEIAKRTVEIYIEKDEEEGINYANTKLKELNIKVD